MDFFEVVARRQSIRSYAPRAVEKEKTDKILAAANDAPSAGNLQAYEIYVVRKREHLSGLAAAALSQDFIAQAPAALVFWPWGWPPCGSVRSMMRRCAGFFAFRRTCCRWRSW